MVSTSLTRLELEFARKLVAGLRSLPEDWQLEPTHLKTPVRPGWTEGTLSRDQIVSRLLNGSWESKVDGFGKYHQFYDGICLRLTRHVVIDVDGAVGLAQKLGNKRLPKTVAWASGKPGHASLLYRLPEAVLASLSAKPIKKIRLTEIDGQTDRKGTAIELLLPHAASVATLPPSNHPDTDGYRWKPGASPSEIEVAIAPDWVIEQIAANQEARRQQVDAEPSDYTKAAPEQLWEHVQEVLATIPNDIAHDDWIKISLAIKGHCPSDSEGFELWSEWSLANGTKRARCTERNWDSFKPATSLSGFYEVSGWSGARYQAGHGRVALFRRPGTKIELTRKPDLHIGDREFSEVADMLPKSGIVALHGYPGTAKTLAEAMMIQGRSTLSVSHLTSIASEQAARFGGTFLNDAGRDNPIGDVVTVCVPSIGKVVGSHEVLIIDETTAVLSFLLESKLANKRGQRPILIAETETRIREAELVIFADANLTDAVLEWAEAIRGEKARLVQSSRKPLGYPAYVIDGTKNEAIAMLQERAAQTDKLIVIQTDSKKLADSLAELLGRKQCLLITSATSGEPAVKALLASKGGTLPELAMQGIRFVVASPSVTQGFSIERHTDLVDSNWLFETGCSITVEGMAQQPDRLRSTKIPRFIWGAHGGSAYSRFSRALVVEEWIEDFKSLSSATARIARNALAGDVTIEGLLERQERNIKLLASQEVLRNQGMVNLRNSLIVALEEKGVQVQYIKPDIAPAAAKLAGQALKEAGQANDRADAQRVAARPLRTQSEIDTLVNSGDPLTQEQQDDVTKFFVVTFYKLEDATAEDVLFDRKGRTRKEITFLERILNPALALEKTEHSLKSNPDCPQDWDSAALQIRYIESSGFANLIRAIASGEVDTLADDLTAPVVEYVRANAEEFRLLFKVRPDRVSDRQIIGEILSRTGIKTKRVGNKNNHRYIIRKPELEALLAIVERRQVAVTPPQEDIDYLTGCDPFLSRWKTSECLEEIRQMWQVAANDPTQRVWLEAETPPEILRLALAA